MSGFFGDMLGEAREMAGQQLEVHRSIFLAIQTANLLTIYNTPNLVDQLSDTDRLELEKTIFQATGIRDA